MYHILKYIKHLLKATNQHGVHSPFVYDFLTKCLYKKPKIKASKSLNLVRKSIPYFKVKSIQTIEEENTFRNQLEADFKSEINQNPPFGLIYIENPSFLSKLETMNMHNDTVVVIDNIHKNKSSSESWKLQHNRNEYTVSIDFFYCGLLFFRKEQVKQHFIIRI